MNGMRGRLGWAAVLLARRFQWVQAVADGGCERVSVFRFSCLCVPVRVVFSCWGRGGESGFSFPPLLCGISRAVE